MEKSSTIILGIDPGTLLMGYCIIEANGDHLRLHELDVLKMSERQDHYLRLQLIHQKVTALILAHAPHCMAIEAPFFGSNVQSMLKLGRAQGVAIAAAMSAGKEVCEYAPRKIKQAITGNGNAAKEQVWKMLQHIMKLQETKIPFLDASDALAVAVCHHFQQKRPLSATRGTVSGWKQFIAMNPQRIKVKKSDN